MKDRFLRSFCRGLTAPRMRKKSFSSGVFHGFIGVIAFIAYALPLMLVTHDIVNRTSGTFHRRNGQIAQQRPGTTSICSLGSAAGTRVSGSPSSRRTILQPCAIALAL